MGPGPGWGYRVAGFADGVGFCVAALMSKVIILAGADKRNTTLSVATAFAVVVVAVAVADVSFGM